MRVTQSRLVGLEISTRADGVSKYDLRLETKNRKTIIIRLVSLITVYLGEQYLVLYFLLHVWMGYLNVDAKIMFFTDDTVILLHENSYMNVYIIELTKFLKW